MLVTIYDIITRMVQIITANAFIMMTVGGYGFSQALLLHKDQDRVQAGF